MVTVLSCKCKHNYQDRYYGIGNRVFNYSVKKNAWCCTVCGAVMQSDKKNMEPSTEAIKKSKKGKK